jgi:hypothetical protein
MQTEARRMNWLVCMITRLYIWAYPVPEHASLLHLVYRLSLDAHPLFFLAMFLTPASKVRRLLHKDIHPKKDQATLLRKPGH